MKKLLALLLFLAAPCWGAGSAVKSTIGAEDINWGKWTDTFTRQTSTGGSLTLHKVSTGPSIDASASPYSVQCDGIADDAAAVRAAITAAGYGGTVLLPAGVCKFGSDIILNGSVRLAGQGMSSPEEAGAVQATVLKASADAKVWVQNGSGVTTHGAIIENLTIDGNSVGSVGLQIGNASGSFESAKGVIRNVVITGTTSVGLKVLGGQGMHFDNVRSIYNTGHGAMLGSASSSSYNRNTTNKFTACEFGKNGTAANGYCGMVIYDADSHVFDKCLFEGNYGAGLLVKKVSADVDITVLFLGCEFLDANNLGDTVAGRFGDLGLQLDGAANGIYGQIMVAGSSACLESILTFVHPRFARAAPGGGAGTYYGMVFADTHATILNPIFNPTMTAAQIRVNAGNSMGRLYVESEHFPWSNDSNGNPPTAYAPITGGTNLVTVENSANATLVWKRTAGTDSAGLHGGDDSYWYSYGGAVYAGMAKRGGVVAHTPSTTAGDEAEFRAVVSGTMPAPGGVGGVTFGLTRTQSSGYGDAYIRKSGLNGAATIPVLLNGTPRPLTSGAAATIVTPTLANGEATAGTIHYAVRATVGADVQMLTGMCKFSAVKKGGTVTGAVTDLAGNQASALSTGTLTLSWAWSGANLQATATSSMGSAVVTMAFTLTNEGEVPLTIAAGY